MGFRVPAGAGMKRLPGLAVLIAMTLCAAVFGMQRLWAQTAPGNECLDEPIDITYAPPDAGEKAKSAGKGILSSVLSSASGGAVRSKGSEAPELSRRPRLPKSRLEIEDADLELEVQGGIIDGALIMAVRMRKDPDKGGPHLVALQDIHCRVLLPERVDVFELWESGGLSVSWSSSTYSDGRMVGSDSGAFDSSWGDLSARYPTTAEIPGIWQSYGEPPLEGLRGVTATFQPPPGETFNPSDWYLVAQITEPSAHDNTITTLPVVSEIEPGDKDRYSFSQAQNVNWQPPVQATMVAASASSTVLATAEAGLACREDCKKILEEINQLQCAKEDCSDLEDALDAALAALAGARAALESAQADAAAARADIALAQNALDSARADLDQAQRRYDVQSAMQRRLQESLARGGHGLSAGQIMHGIQSSQEFVEQLEQDLARAQSEFDEAQAALNAANAALEGANAAIAAAEADVAAKQQAVDAARQALSDCMQREWERCRAIDELWQQYQDCRQRCRDQEDTRDQVDRAGRYVDGRGEDTAEDGERYDSSRNRMNENNRGARDLGGTPPSRARDLANEAAERRREAERLEREARNRLREAESDYRRGDLEGAREAAEEARDLADDAEEAMQDASSLMSDADTVARREYQKLLEEQALREHQQWLAERRAAALKKQACMVMVAEYYAQDHDDTSLLEDLGAFVSGQGKDALDEARDFEYNPEEVQDFLDKVEEYRGRLEQILTLINGIGDNASIESRNEAFATALELAGELAERIPGLSAFFEFYSGAFNAAVQALYALQEEMIGLYKPMADDFIRSTQCCSYSAEQLANTTLEDIVNDKWDQFRRSNSTALARLSGDSLRKLETYFKSRLTLHWTSCCIQYALDG